MLEKDILEAVRLKRKECSRTEIGRKSIIKKCGDCGKRFNHVKIYYANKHGREREARTQYVCFSCGWQQEELSEYDPYTFWQGRLSWQKQKK